MDSASRWNRGKSLWTFKLRPEDTAVAAKSASLIDFQRLVAPAKRTSALKNVSTQVGSLPTQAWFLVTLNRHLRLPAVAASAANPITPSSEWIGDLDADDATVGVTSRLNFIGEAAVFLDVLRFIYRVACCEAPVLLQGETGTGKELAASAIHYLSARRDGPFIPINCGAIPDTLIESELFGHVRGAFTDAKEPRQGVVGQARGGTLFLDELEVISHRGQVALLRFLQDQRYCPMVGPLRKKGTFA